MRRQVQSIVLSTILLVGATPLMAAEETGSTQVNFATVGDHTISMTALEQAVNRRIRTTLYHGQPEEDVLIRIRREVAADLVQNTRLEIEATRRGIKPDEAEITQSMERMAEYMTRRGRAYDEDDLAEAERFLRQENLIDQLKTQVNDVPAPSLEEVEAFYRENPDKFTEPEQIKLSVILLQVDPSSTSAVWAAAREEAAEMYAQLQQGLDFAEQARLRSGDATAENGGDMGYLHRGMLAREVETVIDQLEVGEISEPVQVLEGIILLKLTDRKVAELRRFEEVKERAMDLYRRQQGEDAWNSLKARLESEIPVEYLHSQQ